ncbi:hypothetical protein PI124_g10427 [Phytophthora idaei]|nr:hypothetical protein PI125_g14675 [Phytophthora idaei]KAG3145140.1 hypothetical protein PI126_g13851 [Phytophthora idaei]KAG3244817.1 hypothetical protein PI124_g10427 [Phytophthora idaei]
MKRLLFQARGGSSSPSKTRCLERPEAAATRLSTALSSTGTLTSFARTSSRLFRFLPLFCLILLVHSPPTTPATNSEACRFQIELTVVGSRPVLEPTLAYTPRGNFPL